MKEAIKKKKSILILYWLIPIISIIIAVIMLKDRYELKGKEFVLTIQNAKGLIPKTDTIIFKGIKVGKIESIKIDEDNLSQFKIYGVMYKKYDFLLKKGTQFWKVSPEISLKGVKNLDTIITGSYIEILPPKKNKQELERLPSKYNFIALSHPPLNGITTIIKTKDSSFGIGTILIYRGIQVGEIIDKELKKGDIFYTALIYNKYKNILGKDTKFIPMKPLELKASLNGIKLTIPSIKNLITGAIKIETSIKNSTPKKEYSFYKPLVKGYKFTIISENQLPHFIFYKGFKVGELVSNKLLNNKIYNNYLIYDKYKNLINNSTLFYKLNAFELKGSLTHFSVTIPDFKSTILGGISFITLREKDVLNKRKFKIFNSKMNLDEYLLKKNGGEEITILTKNLDFIKKGTLITYKGLEAGKVLDYNYNFDNNYLELKVFIKKPFLNLINYTTKFYKNGGLTIKAGINGIKVNTPTLNSIIEGTISFIATKDKFEDKKIFKLYNYEDLGKDNYFTINLNLDKINGLKKNSPLIFKGFQIGKVSNIIFDKNISAVIKIDKKFKYLFGMNSKIYLKTFKAGLNGIQNPDSIIFGSKLYLISDENNKFKSNFKLDSINPIDSYYKNGLRIVLTNYSKEGLNIGSPIYYRKVKIGQIEKIELSKTAQNVNIFLFINSKYKNIIRTNSKFFNTGVLAVKANLFGVKIKTGTLESMIKGGIEVVTPDKIGQKVENGAVFKLYDKPEEDWLKYKPKLLILD